MEVIYLKKGQGKTRAAIQIANETGAYLVVQNAHIAQILSRFTKRFPITYHALATAGVRGSFVKKIVIDDTDRFLEYVTRGLEIEAITINKEVVHYAENLKLK